MDPSVSRSEALKTLGELVRALNSRGAGHLRQLLADNVVWSSDLFDLEGDNPEANVSGRGPVADQMEALRGAFEGFAFGIPTLERLSGELWRPLGNLPDEMVVFENGRAAFEFEVDGRGAGFLPLVGTTHRDTDFRGSAVVTFDADARILLLRTTWNCARIMGQLGRHAHGRPGPRDEVVPA